MNVMALDARIGKVQVLMLVNHRDTYASEVQYRGTSVGSSQGSSCDIMYDPKSPINPFFKLSWLPHVSTYYSVRSQLTLSKLTRLATELTPTMPKFQQPSLRHNACSDNCWLKLLCAWKCLVKQLPP